MGIDREGSSAEPLEGMRESAVVSLEEQREIARLLKQHHIKEYQSDHHARFRDNAPTPKTSSSPHQDDSYERGVPGDALRLVVYAFESWRYLDTPFGLDMFKKLISQLSYSHASAVMDSMNDAKFAFYMIKEALNRKLISEEQAREEISHIGEINSQILIKKMSELMKRSEA